MNYAPDQWLYLIGGLAIGLFGWMIYWFGLPVIGGLIGAGTGGSLGYVGAEYFNATPGAEMLIILLSVAVGAIIGVFLTRFLLLYLFFIAGASLGGALTWNFIQSTPLPAGTPGWGTTLAVLVGAILGGALMVILRRFILAVITSVIGAMLFTRGFPPEWQALALVVSLVVFIAFQVGLVRRFVDREEFDRRTRFRLREDRPDVRTAD